MPSAMGRGVGDQDLLGQPDDEDAMPVAKFAGMRAVRSSAMSGTG